MPTVPVPQYERQSVDRPGPVNVANIQQRPGALDAIADFGNNLSGVIQEQKHKTDLAFAQNALLDFNKQADDLINNPQTGLVTKQGANALGQSQQVAGQLSEIADKAYSAIPDGPVKDQFRVQFQQAGQQVSSRAKTYEIGQRQQFEQGQFQATINNYLTQANDPAQFEPAILGGRQSIMEYGNAHGQSQEEIESNWNSFRQKAADSAFDTAYSQMYQQTMGPNGVLPVSSSASSDQLFSAMISAESGGNHFGKDGAPITSSKGATGVAQVMESTGPEAAKLAGLTWDRDKWLNDPRYNATIGHAYFQSQLKRYGGDQVLAVAAYNAGHGQVDQWIDKYGDPRKGEISSADFANKIPFDETRNYVSKVISSAPAIPNNATVTGLMNSPFWNAMSPQAKSAAMSKVSGLYDLQSATGRVNLQSRMQDNVTQVELGQAVTNPVTEREWLAYTPMNATPVERQQLQKAYHQYQMTLDMQPAYQSIVQGTAQQGQATVNAMKPDNNDPDLTFKQQRYAQVASKYAQVLKAREDDPGAWLLQNSSVVKYAAQQLNSNQVSGEYFASRIQAEKERLGIRNKDVLPTEMVNTILSQIDNSNEKSVAAIQNIAQDYGSMAPVVMSQLQGKSGSALSVVMSLDNMNAANALFQNRKVSTDDLKKSSGAQANSVESEWAGQFADFGVSLASQRGGLKAYSDFNEQGKRLAYIYAAQGMSGSAAAKMAFNQIAGDQYDFEGTWRLPKSLNLNTRDINDGLSNYLNKLKPDDISPAAFTSDPRLPADVGRAMALSRIKNNAEWVTSEDERGLYLTADRTYINGADGNPIFVPFKELSQLGIADRSFINKALNDLKTPATFTPAEGISNVDVNQDLSDVYRSLRGEPAREFEGYQGQQSGSKTLSDALNRRGGQ